MKHLNIGMVGLDTSHAVAFTKLLNDEKEADHIKGGRVVIAFPGGSPDFDLSISRVEGFTKQVKGYDVEIADSIEKTAEKSDALFLESVDGAQHLEQLKKIIPYRKPVFIDKPFALSSEEANQMVKLSEEYGTPLMSTSALRFAEGLTTILEQHEKEKIIGADCFGPMEIQQRQPGFFWYGIHTVEMLFAIFGEGAEKVISTANQDHDVLTAFWKDGRIGTIRGNRKGNNQFGAIIHFEHGSEFVSINSSQKPFYASLLKQIMSFFQCGLSPVPLSETLELIRFIEAANESRYKGKSVSL